MIRLARHLVLMCIMFAAAILALTPAAAQEGTGVRPEEYPGLESAVSRTFVSQSGATPAPNGSSPVIYVALYAILDFDTPENATAGMATATNEMTAGLFPGVTATPTPLEPGVADADAVVNRQTALDETYGARSVIVIIDPEGDKILMATVVVLGDGLDPTALATRGIADVKATPTGDPAAIAFNADGSSTGGTWDQLPKPGTYPELAGYLAVDTWLYDPNAA